MNGKTARVIRLVSVLALGAMGVVGFQNCSSALPDEAKNAQASVAPSDSSVLSIRAPANEVMGLTTLPLTGVGGTPPYRFSVITGSGTLDASNLFTAPAVGETDIVQVTDAKNRTATIEIKVTAALTLTSSSSLATEVLKLTATGGYAPYTYQLMAGAGTLAGDEFTPATYSATPAQLQVTDAKGNKAQLYLTMTMPATVSVYRWYGGFNSAPVYSLDPNGGAPLGYAFQGAVFKLFQSALATNSLALVKCAVGDNASTVAFYVAANSACPLLYSNRGVVGYISTVARPNTVPLYALAAYPYMLSKNPAEFAAFGGGVTIVGYVMP